MGSSRACACTGPGVGFPEDQTHQETRGAQMLKTEGRQGKSTNSFTKKPSGSRGLRPASESPPLDNVSGIGEQDEDQDDGQRMEISERTRRIPAWLGAKARSIARATPRMGLVR